MLSSSFALQFSSPRDPFPQTIPLHSLEALVLSRSCPAHALRRAVVSFEDQSQEAPKTPTDTELQRSTSTTPRPSPPPTRAHSVHHRHCTP